MNSPTGSAAHSENSLVEDPPKVPLGKRLHPGYWVPSLYFAEGLPMITVSVVAAIMYKNLGISNTDIAIYTGSLYLPWSLKPLWAPAIEMFKTKRHWVLATEFAMAICFALIALSINLPWFLGLTLAFFWITGFLSSTQDIAADGVYISVTTPKEQSAFVGVQGMFWNSGRVVASGLLIWVTGYLFDASVREAVDSEVSHAAKVILTVPLEVPEERAKDVKALEAQQGNITPDQLRTAHELAGLAKDWGTKEGEKNEAPHVLSSEQAAAVAKLNAASLGGYQKAWVVVMFAISGMMALLGLWHLRALPQDPPVENAPKSASEALETFGDTIRTFFKKPSIWMGLTFIILYRSGEGFIEKIGPLFLLDPVSAGGLGLKNQDLGTINGVYGTLGFIAGALLGGLFAAKRTLKKSIVFLAVAMNVPHICYNLLAAFQPDPSSLVGHAQITALITVEKFGYGFGSVAMMLYMMHQIAPGKYRTAHYAFATSIMNLGIMIPSMLSGAIQTALGYEKFFVFVLIASIPSIIAAKFAPFPHEEEAGGPTAVAGH